MTDHDPHHLQSRLDALRKFRLTLDDVRAHVVEPDNIVGAKERLRPIPPDFRIPPLPFASVLYSLNIERLGRELQELLGKCLTGYSLQLRRRGAVVLSQQSNWAKTPIDGSVNWASDVPMHLASVSKLITAMALTKLLIDRRISCDAKIAQWLPRYWPKGANVDQLTFRHLLTHRSGLNASGEITPCDFTFTKNQIGMGTTIQPMPIYRNVNYSLCRILISTVSGGVDPGFIDEAVDPLPGTFHFPTDLAWDLVSIQSYSEYVNSEIFAPAGVAARAFDHPLDAALAYVYPTDNQAGWDSGDLQTVCGAAGWHLSSDELLRVLAKFRRSGLIVSPAKAEQMLDNGFGIDWQKDTLIGKIYAKGGFWSNNNRVEQSNAFLLPRGMELVILANSPFCKPDGGAFMDQVAAKIDQCIEFSLSSILTRLVDRFRIGA